jgi:hypothetical protein
VRAARGAEGMPRRGRAGSPRRGARGGRQGRAQGGRAGKKKGWGRGREREMERGGEESSPRGSKFRRSPSPRPRAPQGERDGREREVVAWEKSNERKRPGEGGARMGEGTGARGASGRAGPDRAGLGRAGLGRTAGQNPVARTTTDRNSICEAKSETRLSNARD